ncbi:MAG: hypothetical protein ABI411_11815 [Tahibacter sp.]
MIDDLLECFLSDDAFELVALHEERRRYRHTEGPRLANVIVDTRGAHMRVKIAQESRHVEFQVLRQTFHGGTILPPAASKQAVVHIRESTLLGCGQSRFVRQSARSVVAQRKMLELDGQLARVFLQQSLHGFVCLRAVRAIKCSKFYNENLRQLIGWSQRLRHSRCREKHRDQENPAYFHGFSMN